MARGVMGKLTEKRVNAIIVAVGDKVERYEVLQYANRLSLRLYLLDGDIWEFSDNRTVKYVSEFVTGQPYNG